jgi:spore coat protein U-like protein
MRTSIKALALTAALPLLWFSPAQGTVVSGTMAVRITILDECKIKTATDMVFGTTGVIDANVDQTSTITVQCTTGTPYNVGLGAGAGSGATIAVRKMTSPAAAVINYSLYSDSGRAQLWGTTIGGDTVAGTGNGALQPLTVYGRVPPQTTPGAGVYTDTVAITVTY